MDELSSTGVAPKPPHSGADACFDASQYAFFGKSIKEEVELGGLVDCDNEDVCPGESFDEEIALSILDDDDEEVEDWGYSSDDLASTFSRLNRSVSGPRHPGVIGDRGSFSRESSSTADWSQEADFSNWFDQRILDAEHAQEGKRWSSQPHTSSYHHSESKPLSRTSSYPLPPLQNYGESTLLPRNNYGESTPLPRSFTSYPPPGGAQTSLGLSSHSNAPAFLPFSMSNAPQYAASQLRFGGPHGVQYGGNMGQFNSSGHPINNPEQNLWLNQANLFLGDQPNLLHKFMSQQLPPSAGSIAPQVSRQQNQILHRAQSSPAYPLNLQSQLFSPRSSPPHLMSKLNMMFATTDKRDQRPKPVQRRQNSKSSQRGSDVSDRKSDPALPKFRSKYMSSEEIESIQKMQHSSSHSNDLYFDDYYHQACLAKSSDARIKQRFYPSTLRELPARSRSNIDPRAYLQADAVGKVPFPSIRRPRALLGMDQPSDGGSDRKPSVKPLEQEPLLAARITLEDCLCLLLDVDDIDRVLRFNLPQDGGSQLRRRRQTLLEGLAASLQLVDPLAHGKSGNGSTVLASKDDVVFLRLVSLPKGRKFLARFLNLLYPGSDLTRIVCMTIFRHLRFLFGGISTDSNAAVTTTNLATMVSSCMQSMDLGALSACLAAVVCSSEQPPLRPIGSSAGDGASVIIKSVLDRATELLTDHHSASNYSLSTRSLWQASFDAFFGLLTKYCLSKYDSMMQSLLLRSPGSVDIGPEGAKAISREMPVELLRASLPHTDEHQRKVLQDFAQKSMPVAGVGVRGTSGGQRDSESVPC